ncbi:MAG: DUF5706 domain-containing protein [Myxococcota bacterium]|nr:DUF5706 domain-containing protein [Myxococcota bacterium]
MDKNEYAHETNKFIYENIKFADTKAGAIFVAVGMLGTIVCYIVNKLLTIGHNIESLIADLACWFSIVPTFAICMVAYYCLIVLLPRLKEADASLNSFPDIADPKNKQEDYLEKMALLSEELIWKEYSKHNWILSDIATQKHRAIKKSIHWLIVAMIGSFILSVFYLAASSLLAKTGT